MTDSPDPTADAGPAARPCLRTCFLWNWLFSITTPASRDFFWAACPPSSAGTKRTMCGLPTLGSAIRTASFFSRAGCWWCGISIRRTGSSCTASGSARPKFCRATALRWAAPRSRSAIGVQHAGEESAAGEHGLPWPRPLPHRPAPGRCIDRTGDLSPLVRHRGREELLVLTLQLLPADAPLPAAAERPATRLGDVRFGTVVRKDCPSARRPS